MSKRALLEVIALGPEDAVAAQAGGADRLELVTDMAADGLTPPRSTFAAIRAAVDIPLRVMLRSADGFAAGDVAALCEEAAALRAEGAEEFVLGFLTPDGRPDLVAVRALAEVIEGCRWTFHRAIDRAADRDALRKELAAHCAVSGTGDSTRSSRPAPPKGSTRDCRRSWPSRAVRQRANPGTRRASWSAAASGSATCRNCARPGIDAFHIGGAARPAGWSAPVDVAAVRQWRDALDGVLDGAPA